VTPARRVGHSRRRTCYGGAGRPGAGKSAAAGSKGAGDRGSDHEDPTERIQTDDDEEETDMNRNRPDADPRRARLHVTLTLALAALVLVPALALAGPGPSGPGRSGAGRDGGLGLGEGVFGPGPFAAGAAGEGPGGGLPPLHRLAFFLDLTADQVTQAQAIFDAAQAEIEPLREAQRPLFEQLRAALDAAEPDPAAVGALVIDLHANRQAIHAVLEGALDEFEAILTPEQLERFEVLRDARRAFGPRHRRHGRG
jgi:Spy/CpxP family protein refolding chaperone